MINQTINSIDSKELYAQYNWFAVNYPSAIQAACDDFFNPGFQLIFQGISKNVNALMDKDSYFVTKIRIDKLHDMFFRLSEKTVGLILNKILGDSVSRFNLNKLTDLEAKIITSFNDNLFSSISKFLSPAPALLKRSNFDVIHLNFLIKDIDSSKVGKFIVTLPEELLNPEKVESKGASFSYDDFASSFVNVTIKVGKTKLKLIDLKNISEDDVVVLDNSNQRHMILKFNDYEKSINLNPNLGLVLPFDNEGDEEMAENTNLWDSIEVEMNAQFDTVKITLGELKKIEQGLVVDLTSIYDNKVTLSVENKPIARGELVIVNDRYGVKVQEVVASKPLQTIENATELENNDEFNDNQTFEQEVIQNNNNEEDEFDYSDFELEDEDI